MMILDTRISLVLYLQSMCTVCNNKRDICRQNLLLHESSKIQHAFHPASRKSIQKKKPIVSQKSVQSISMNQLETEHSEHIIRQARIQNSPQSFQYLANMESVCNQPHLEDRLSSNTYKSTTIPQAFISLQQGRQKENRREINQVAQNDTGKKQLAISHIPQHINPLDLVQQTNPHSIPSIQSIQEQRVFILLLYQVHSSTLFQTRKSSPCQ